MTTYYKCRECGLVFGTWRRSNQHDEKDGHGTYPMAKHKTPIDESEVIYD